MNIQNVSRKTGPSAGEFQENWESFVKKRKAWIASIGTSTSTTTRENPKCDLCMDKKFLIVEYAWIMTGSIPDDFNLEAVCIRTKRGNPLTMLDPRFCAIPCDCNTKPDKPATVFSSYFGTDARKHFYGKTILDYREMLVEMRDHEDPNELNAARENALGALRNMLNAAQAKDGQLSSLASDQDDEQSQTDYQDFEEEEYVF